MTELAVLPVAELRAQYRAQKAALFESLRQTGTSTRVARKALRQLSGLARENIAAHNRAG